MAKAFFRLEKEWNRGTLTRAYGRNLTCGTQEWRFGFRGCSFSIGWFGEILPPPQNSQNHFYEKKTYKHPQVTTIFSTSQDLCSCFLSSSQTFFRDLSGISVIPFCQGLKALWGQVFWLKKVGIRGDYITPNPKPGTVDGWKSTKPP